MEQLNLDRLFNPRHIAMIGASETPGKWGFLIMANILKGNYTGKFYPVNPKRESILGMPSYKSAADLPEPVDVAVVTTPAHSVPDLMDQFGARGIPNVVLVSSDFSEAGQEGAALEREVVARARKYNIRVVGPNTMGIFSAETSLHILMPTVEPPHGVVSMFSQSGNFGTQLLQWGEEEEVGFEKFASSGNEGDLNCVDYLRYFGQDKATGVILGYIEGVDSGSEFLSVAKGVSREKPIVIFKGGRSKQGAKAAASHTGAMAGSFEVYESAFRQAGIIRVSKIYEIIDCAKAFSSFPLPKGNRVGILTRGGGWGVITTDTCAANNMKVAPLPDEVIKKISNILPKYWSHGNPIDMVAVAAMEPFMECLEILASWEGVDSVIALAGRTGSFFKVSKEKDFHGNMKPVREILLKMESDVHKSHGNMISFAKELMLKTEKPIMFVDLSLNDEEVKNLRGYRPFAYPTPERAVKALRRMWDYKQFLNG